LQDALEHMAVHFTTRVAPNDMARLSGIFRAPPSFLQAQRPEPVKAPKLPKWIDYALYYPSLEHAISVRLRYGNLENFDTSNMYRGARSRSQQSGSGQQQSKSSNNQQSGTGQSNHQNKDSGSSSKKAKRGPNDLEIEVAGNPAKMKKGGKQTFQYDGKRHELDIPPGTKPRVRSKDGKHVITEGDAFPMKGILSNGGILWVVLTKHPDIKDEPEDMDTGASRWP
jgi:hypothetical protein